ncbi:MAG: hypothetical protein IPK22_09985 [Verrucomicrobiaceae bacterium]|nr:hypothetical protein [Verrucomicrobiaceae bacterium]
MNTTRNPDRQKNVRQKYFGCCSSLFALHFFACLLAPAASAQSTLPALQQSYEKAVADKATAPHLAAVAELNQKYSAAIDRLTTAATQAGDLDTALALREEKSRLLPEGSLPEDSETTPAALKAARATYRQQVAALQAARDAATQPLKDHFTTLLQSLLTQTTQAGKLDEALAIREKIASLSSGPANTPAQVPDSKTSPPARSSKLTVAKSTGKTDPEAARQIIAWALAHDSSVTTSLGIVGAEEKLTAPPAGKFSVTEIRMGQSADFPWSALDGLGELQKFIPQSDAPLAAEQTRHYHNLGSLRFLKMIAITEDGVQAMPVLPNLVELELSFDKQDPLPILHLIQERTASIQILTPFRLPSGEIADAVFSKFSGWPNFKKLQGGTWITARRTAHLVALPKFTEMGLMTGAKVDEGCLPQLKSLVSIGFNGPQPPAILRDLTALPKLGRITLDLEGMTVADIPDFSPCKTVTEINLDNTPAPAAEVVGKFSGITGLKIYKLSHTEIDPPTIAHLLSFKGLEVLSLNECKFAPEAFAALQQLKALKTLKELNFKNSGIPPADLKALQKALGKVTIRDK